MATDFKAPGALPRVRICRAPSSAGVVGAVDPTTQRDYISLDGILLRIGGVMRTTRPADEGPLVSRTSGATQPEVVEA